MLQFPFEAPPHDEGVPVEVAEGLLWVRFTIPFALNHVNIFLLRDGDGWLAVDAGINSAATHAASEHVFGLIGGRRWTVILGGGQSPAPVMLHCADERLLIAGDQILSRISPFVGAFADTPRASPLRDYLAFLDQTEPAIPDATLVLPGHGAPF